MQRLAGAELSTLENHGDMLRRVNGAQREYIESVVAQNASLRQTVVDTRRAARCLCLYERGTTNHFSPKSFLTKSMSSC